MRPHVYSKRPARSAIVDEYGELVRKTKEFAPTMERKKHIEKQIQSWFDDGDPAESYVESGSLYSVHVGPRRRERRIVHMARLFAYVGKTAFLTCCTVPLTVLDRLVPSGEQEKYVTEEQSGPRRLESVAAVPAKLAA